MDDLIRESIRNQNDVALGLNKKLFQTEGKESNAVYSPLSIHVVLSLIAAGSKGPIQDQLLSFLKSKSADHLNSFAAELISVIFSDGFPSGGPRLSFANGIWVNRPLLLKPSFKQVVDTAYKAALSQVNFQTNSIHGPKRRLVALSRRYFLPDQLTAQPSSSLQMRYTSKEFGTRNLMHQ